MGAYNMKGRSGYGIGLLVVTHTPQVMAPFRRLDADSGSEEGGQSNSRLEVLIGMNQSWIRPLAWLSQ